MNKENFLTNVIVPDDHNSCWEWKGRVGNDGYGRCGRDSLAHRVSYELFIGIIPKDHILRHLCHNPLCVNPNHLIPGTHQDNVLDKVLANRQAKGESSGMAKLSVEDIHVIRLLYSKKEVTQYDLALAFGVSQRSISNIVRRLTWNHISAL